MRRGDRLRKSDGEAWTDLSDGAAFEASLLLNEAFRTSDLADAMRSLTPRGLRSAGRSGILWLLSELDPDERAELAETLSQPMREIRPARFDGRALHRFAKALRSIARSLEENE